MANHLHFRVALVPVCKDLKCEPNAYKTLKSRLNNKSAFNSLMVVLKELKAVYNSVVK